MPGQVRIRRSSKDKENNSAEGVGAGVTEESRNLLDREEKRGHFWEWKEMLRQRGMFGDQRGSGWLKLGIW